MNNAFVSSPAMVTGWQKWLVIMACFLAGIGIPLSLALENIASGLMVVAFVCVPALWRELPRVCRQPYVVACLVLYGVMLIGVSYTSVPLQRAGWMLMKKREFLFVPLLFAVCLIPVARKSLLSGFGLGVFISILASLLVAAFNKPFMNASPGDWSVFHTHTYHNYFVTLVVASLICLWLAGSISPRWKWPAALVILISTFDVLFLVSGRTGQIIYLLLIALPFLLWRWRAGLLLSLLGAVVVIPALLFFSGSINKGIDNARQDFVAYQQGNADTSLGLRFEFYRHSLQLLAEKPVLGHGTGSFVQEYQRVSGVAKGVQASRNPHNDYFWFGVELGALGVLALIGVIGAAIVQACKRNTAERWMGICLAVSMGVATMANSFFTDNLTGLGFALLACALLAGDSFGVREERSRFA